MGVTLPEVVFLMLKAAFGEIGRVKTRGMFAPSVRPPFIVIQVVPESRV